MLLETLSISLCTPLLETKPFFLCIDAQVSWSVHGTCVHRYISFVSLAADGEQCHLLPLAHSPKNHRSDPKKWLCASLLAVFLTSHTGVDLEVPPSFQQGKVTCYSKFLFIPEFSVTESIKKRAMGALPVSILISRRIIVPAREERKKTHK